MSYEDKSDILDLISKYCFFIDSGKMTELAALFTETGSWTSKFGHAECRADVEVLLRKLVPAPTPDALRRHITVNTVIDLAGQTASAFSYFFVARSSEQGPVVSTVGSYTDSFVKTSAGWLFQTRRLSHDIVGDIGLAR
jgi:SnoaL-like domain